MRPRVEVLEERKSLVLKGIRTPDLPASSLLAIHAKLPRQLDQKKYTHQIQAVDSHETLVSVCLSLQRTWLYIRPIGSLQRTSVLLRVNDVPFFSTFSRT
jgi:hypothetical protein